MSCTATMIGLLAALAPGADRGDAAAFFRERVAPLLEARCLHCHGDSAPKGGLSLTTAGALRKGGASGPAVVPGAPDESPLIEAVRGSPPEMPRKGDPLTPEQVADLRDWVTRGASWPDGLTLRDRRFEGPTWWAFAPLDRPPVPGVKATGRVRTPVDAFLLARLDREGLRPSPEADRRTLIRRLTYDLHGLPPSPDEVDAFLADSAPDAYERLADRLLASPRYGERMGRHWLDLAHYADTHGYDKDKRRDHAWPYRDYVIRAFNADLPYARFVRQQVAGDVLDPADPDSVAATGFVAAGPWDFVGHVELREGTVDKAKARLNDRDDMLANVMSTFQSLTVHCARCHDHKFDPIPQAEYYGLQAVFAGVDRGDRPYPDPSLDARRRQLTQTRDSVARRLERAEKAIRERTEPALRPIDAQVSALREAIDALPRPGPVTPSPTNGYHSAIHPVADAPAWVQVDLGGSVVVEEIRLIPARPTDFPDTPGFGFPARFLVALSDNPAFPAGAVHLAEVAARPDDDGPYVVRPVVRARYVRVAASRLWKRLDDFVFALAELEVISGGENVALGRPVSALDSIEGGRWGRRALVDGFDSRRQRPTASDPHARQRADLAYRLQQARRDRHRQADALVPPALRAFRASLVGVLRALDDRIKAMKPAGQVYSLVRHAPRPVHVLRRGDVEQPGATARPGALSCLPALDPVFPLPDPNDEGARRAALADWLASPNNVLTWRSMANRVWLTHFGRALVDTPNDFGRNGSRPTHPELLDWLATELRDNGGSVKALHRLIVTSAAYRQASRGEPAAEALDADNRWLWRQDRRRLDAESVRDAVLSVSGTLDGRMGGPGFDLFRFKDDHSPVYDHAAPGASDNPRVRRRTVYRFSVRSVPNPFLECLDAADPNLNTPVRSTTITALQALALLNDPFIVGQSRALAARLSAAVGGLDSQVELAYRLALARSARPEERAALANYARRHGLAAACRVLLNTNEFLFVD